MLPSVQTPEKLNVLEALGLIRKQQREQQGNVDLGQGAARAAPGPAGSPG